MNVTNFITKAIPIIYLILLGGCSTLDHYSTVIKYDVKYGHFESLSIDEWSYEVPVCVILRPESPSYGERWVPKIGVSYQTNDFNNVFHLEMVDLTKDVFQLNTRVKNDGGEFTLSTLENGIRWRSTIHLRLSVSNDGVLSFQHNDTLREIPMGFIPERISFIASSMKAQVSYTVDSCK